MDTCIRMVESLCCLLEAITRLLTGYTPIQNKKFKVWEEFSCNFFKVFFILLFSSGTSFMCMLVCSMIPHRSPRLYSFLFIPFLGWELTQWLSSKESDCNSGAAGRCRFNPWVGKIPWKRERLPNPVFLPGKSHGQRSLVGYSPRGHRESDMTERLTHTYSLKYAALEFCYPLIPISHLL